MTEGRLTSNPPASAARITDIVSRWALERPAQPALIDQAGASAYGELPNIILETAAWLAAKDVRPGDRVMIVCENSRTAVALILGSNALGAWPVIVNARLSEREIGQIREHSGARRIFYTVGVLPRAKAHADRDGAIVEDLCSLGPVGYGPLNSEAIPEPVEEDAAQRVAALIYTSGTTGQPKGVMLTHANLLLIARVTGKLRRISCNDRIYAIVPISHILGLSAILLGMLYYGGTIQLVARFDPALTFAAFERDKITMMMGTPATFALLNEYAERKGLSALQLPHLRYISTAGAPLDPAIKAATESLFGQVLNNGYGTTECSPTVTQTRLDQPRSDCSVGPIIPEIEVKLVTLDGSDALTGDVGELWVCGPSVMKGYYRAPEETAAAINAEGWFNTHDLARFEGDHLFIVGRTKELIIRFGFNVYPPEIEGVLNAYPGVLQSAVIGRAVSGDEDIIAFVQPVEGAKIAPADLAAHAARQLAPYKQPSEIFIVESLPAGSTGKILKAKLLPVAEDLIAARTKT